MKKAAAVLADIAQSRRLPYYIVDVPLTSNGDGPATVGVDVASVVYEVWDAVTLATISSHECLSDAITAMLYAIAEQRDN